MPGGKHPTSTTHQPEIAISPRISRACITPPSALHVLLTPSVAFSAAQTLPTRQSHPMARADAPIPDGQPSHPTRHRPNRPKPPSTTARFRENLRSRSRPTRALLSLHTQHQHHSSVSERKNGPDSPKPRRPPSSPSRTLITIFGPTTRNPQTPPDRPARQFHGISTRFSHVHRATRRPRSIQPQTPAHSPRDLDLSSAPSDPLHTRSTSSRISISTLEIAVLTPSEASHAICIIDTPNPMQKISPSYLTISLRSRLHTAPFFMIYSPEPP